MSLLSHMPHLLLSTLDVDALSPHRDTTLCGRVPFPERSHCVDRFGFPGPPESANPILGRTRTLYGAVYICNVIDTAPD